MKLTRRSFLSTLAVGTAGYALQALPLNEASGPLYDFHVHLFGVGDGGTGCFISPRQQEHWTYWFFRRLLKLRPGRMDQDYLAQLVGQLRTSSVQKGVLLAQDARYDRRGEMDKAATNFFTPNDYVFKVVDQYPDLFIPCVSINPKRRDALEELDRCAELGARVLKIHPPTQDVDPAEDSFRPFYRRLAEHRILLMVHTGMEHSSEVVGHHVSDPARLRPALEQGCTVIASHAGSGAYFDDKGEYSHFLPNLLDLIRHFPSLYCDTAVLTAMFRWRNLPDLLAEETVLDRIVYASDWPFPANALVFWNRLPPRLLLELCSETNLFERNYQLQRALGLPAASFERGAQLLATSSEDAATVAVVRGE